MTNTRRQHQIIEASAGTGKTYSIEEEVVRLIVKDGIPLSRILIVTFTEKATGELRRRVRSKLELAWRSDPQASYASALRSGLDAFDDAAIYTIHGFCARVLCEYAFEAKLPFDLQQLDDPQLWERLFARSLRGYWRRDILTDDDPMRCRTVYNDKFYQRDVQQVAQKLMPGDVLLPDPRCALASSGEAVSAILATLAQTFGNVPDDVENTSFLTGVSALKIHASTKKSLVTQYTALLTSLQHYQHEGLSATMLDEILCWQPTDTLVNNIPILITEKLLREEDGMAIVTLINLQNTLKGSVITHAITQLAESVSRYKREGSYIDFNDMLLLVQTALQPPSSLLDVLRERFTVALLDEFQDTDPVQWDIFRRLFKDDDAHQLIIVGDPKQAIYSFRGANVNVYLAARDELEQQASLRRSLTVNWRSYPPLIEALNALFAPASGWFGDGDIQHKDVSAPLVNEVRARLYADASGRRPLTLLQLPEKISGTQARITFAHFIAGEIKHLLDSGIEIAEWRGATPYRRPLHPGDLCILIRSRSELPALARALRQADIPYSFPKQGGLFTTREAAEWRYLLRAIAAPDEQRTVIRALLTRFFQCDPETMESYLTLPDTHQLKQLLASWHALAERRAWAPLLHAIFADTGVLIRELPGDDGERTVTNHQHLAQLLHQQAVQTCGTIDDLIAYLDTRCLHADEDETDLQRIETERRKVQIMTMHAAKGLEFSVVFLAGGFTTGAKNKGYPSYTTPEGRVYAFDKNPEADGLQKIEADADNRRLYYVALTRARFKLYVPCLLNPKRNSGALASFVGVAMEQAWPRDTWEGDDRVAYLPVSLDGSVPPASDGWCAPLDDATGVASWAQAEQAPSIDESRLVLPHVDHAWAQRVTRVTSFSALSNSERPPDDALTLHFTPSEETGGQTARAIDDDATDLPQTESEVEELPHGAATGTLLHAILEKIDYPDVLSAADADALLLEETSTRKCIDQMLNRYPLWDNDTTSEQRLLVARIIWQTLRTPLSLLEGVPLAALTDRRHEVEFWLPAHGLCSAGVPDIRLEHTYLSGFIDLLFRYEGRYYVLDWKSNWSPSGDYGRSTLDGIMRAHNYDLQYRIYLLALDRLLRLSLSGYNPAIHLGGICYVFLRGIGVGENGIYYVPAGDIDMEQVPTELARRIMSVF